MTSSARALRVALFDYGAGNLHSLGKALEGGGADVRVTSEWRDALSEDALVLPGVGAFGAAVRALRGEGERVREALQGGLPCLGICLGMQLYFDRSEESEGEGIGLIPGAVTRLTGSVVPQMGWNDVDPSGDPLFESTGVEGGDSFPAYYANSYVCRPDDRSAVIACSEYDGDLFPAAVRARNSWGVQFHPEKSSDSGVRLVHNFLDRVRTILDGGEG